MSNYFKNFPKIEYKFADGTTKKLVDLTIKYQLSDVVSETADVFYGFDWRDGDRPDSIADKYYDSSDYYWLVMQSNKIFDLNYELPLTEQQFNDYLFKKYSDNVESKNLEEVLEYCVSTTHHYIDEDGDIIDQATFINSGVGAKEISIYDYEYEENEKKRQIKLIEATRASDIKRELENKLRKLKSNGE